MRAGAGRGPVGDEDDGDDLGSMSGQILALREHLIAEQVSCVVMESTGDYWKPFYYLLGDGLNVMLVNPGEARNRRAARPTSVRGRPARSPRLHGVAATTRGHRLNHPVRSLAYQLWSPSIS